MKLNCGHEQSWLVFFVFVVILCNMRRTNHEGGANDSVKANHWPRRGVEIQVYRMVVVATAALAMMMPKLQRVAAEAKWKQEKEVALV